MSDQPVDPAAPAPGDHGSKPADPAIPKFAGNPAMMMGALVVGVLGLGATGMAISQDAGRGWLSYLVGFTFWFTIGLGSLLQLLFFRASAARWVIGIRRLIEVFASSMIPLLVLLLPVLFIGLSSIYPWVGHPAPAEGMTDPTFKNMWLTPSMFTIRAGIAFAAFIVVGVLLLRWSTQQDGDLSRQQIEDLVRKQVRLGSGGAPIVFLLATFFIFDLLMSLEPGWSSTIFGAYIIAGGFMAAMAMTIIVTHQLNRPGQLQGYVTETHLHNMGKIMFAAICFWTYMAVSQYLLQWISNLPEEIPWFIKRMRGEWRPFFFALAFLHFMLPFVLLLPKQAKINTNYVSMMAAYMMTMHFIDVSWVILPSHPGTSLAWSDFTAVLGVGGIQIAWILFRLKGQQVIPKSDPDYAYHAPAHSAAAAH
jgi:hypothetical protein